MRALGGAGRADHGTRWSDDHPVVGAFIYGTIHAEVEPQVTHFTHFISGVAGDSDETVKINSLSARGGVRVLFVATASTCRAPGVGLMNTNSRCAEV